MNVQEALENIKFTVPRFPREEILCIREHKGEAIPVLVEYVRALTDDADSLQDDYNGYLYAMFLLAEFRANEAFPHLIKYLETGSDFTEYWLGDVITENFGSILASVATVGDIPRLKTIIENAELDTFHRLAALTALQTLYTEDAYPRDDYFAYLHALLREPHEDTTFTAFVIIDCDDGGAREFFPEIEKLFADHLVNEEVIKLRDIQGLLNADKETAKQELKKRRYNRFVRDTVELMGNWDCFKEKPDFGYKVGRNEPCPCGSGKKYKKCCGF
ncbi:MAG: DUF1186 domain-containing protein [Zoogloeaceae bacterium]|jgi:hypothetical protein|nr:DUF1186 domain-containing protein [Zoogloeaceae bacterium]